MLRFANSTTLFEKDIKKIEKGNVTGGASVPPVQEQDEAEALALRKKEVF